MSEIYKGLAGVPVDYTAISKVNPETNSLLYRGYPVQELAATQPFESVAYLLWHGELPTEEQLGEFESTERSLRGLDANVKAVIDSLPTDCHPMDVVRTAVSVIGANDPKTADESPEAELEKAINLFAKLPSIVAYDQRRRRGEEFVTPDPELDYSANFLWQTFGRKPDDFEVDAFRVSLILYAEHSFNASTFTARVITSTLSDLYSAVTGAIGALKGPLHGGANEAVLHEFEEIGYDGDVEQKAYDWLQAAFAEKKKIMGFGHRVYKKGDSRVPTMQKATYELIERYDRPEIKRLYEALAKEMDEAKGIKPNLDYPAGPAYYLLGFDIPTFTPIFVAARVTGWTAHIIEQRANNALIRPLSLYNGVDERHVPGFEG
ncbi:bifunctional 2-methylcitrate synthase/citrate synthase [Pseudoclavibacter caeni]|uniref:Citrate synthase n=1 Tax=Pseudoclavibacter caeni TaxID=908846 RepID=A0A7C8BP08_9MICO|nr:bifunctional 2-methylcitrate synthase/citrate synthase [Pseudoclavibacter caeni]KAB1633450.1 bifunctional 2-methylcitrate synthase/citrate synthase [Pseudoclavibacter caeni]NYJ96561.1 2-methylcitrate synthase/citrate synthase II [Pseudoclavibacter caeni]